MESSHNSQRPQTTTMNGRKRSRTNSSLNSSFTPPTFHRRPPNDDPPRLLRLNVGGHPYDVLRTSFPLLETMMTDRWLDTCLYDSDGRIFLDRDGEVFGDILRCLRSPDFLRGLKRRQYEDDGGVDRLRRLRSEADYYGLQDSLVRMIDDVTIGQRVVLEGGSWARVAGGCLVRRQDQEEQEGAGANGGEVAGQRGEREDIDQNNAENEMDNDDNDDAMDQVDENEGDDENEVRNEEPMLDDDAAEEPNGDGAQDLEEEDENNEDADEDEADEEEQYEFVDEDQDDPNQPPPYKRWSWSRQYGNPEILRPHSTHSQMIVGQDGTYLMLLRFAAALPSPLARIKWDEEEEEDRRVTRGAARRRRRDNHSGADQEDENNRESGSSKEVEEDYFITVNIEAPLQTVMDYIDESQTHFPLLRAGLWDYRTEEEVLHEDPVFATVCAMDVVSLRAGDKLTVSYMNDEISRESCPLPDDAPPELLNSLTLIKLNGNTLARYERLKSSPDVMQGSLAELAKSDRAQIHPALPERKGVRSRRMKTDHHHDEQAEDGTNGSPLDDFDYEMEEFDRSLTRVAHWIEPRNDFQSTPFQPTFSHASSVLEFPHSGQYLLTGRVAVGCRRDATFLQVLEGGPVEGHRTQLSLRSAGGRLLHSLGAFAFETKPRLGCSDLSILSENGMFNDIVYVPKAGTELSISTTGDCRLHPEGTEVGPFCAAISQSLSVLLLDDDMMEVDRYMVGTVRSESSEREIKWFHTPNASAPRSRGKGGTLTQPSLFDVDGHRLVWRGYLDRVSLRFFSQELPSPASQSSTSTVLVIGSIPPLHRGYILGLMKNNELIALSITPESLDMKGRHCHYFQEIVELRDSDEITIVECGYGGDDGERGWRDHLHIEPRRIELDTMMGHLAFLVLQTPEYS
ncbi:hypothetical protein HJC23_013665 [Cyclotella cryptica]|uniref:Potassium channel tetramerisation-type BTB domain-containing protein n=1 Tax=Cyclotella cryptica TaxID=29204 RepID=A0ABD3QYF9_9STRA|eukprot:CCRYP_001494-RA/>CCRYP_001494-RA protein AED:0.10 eAED:0.10 QI:331/1/1/1/0.77/0.6/10/2990/909